MTIPHAILSVAEGRFPVPGVTYYEVCMASAEPLAGAHTAECVDLREELEFFRNRRLSKRTVEARKSRASSPLVDHSHLHDDSWLDVSFGLNPQN